ncbi:hypothetical protein [Lentibacillus sp. CBA3610]|uniref:hypothetical protein n=1 Tax=Lentibacillus sp. CBA3610 TaxID=2518176 RepID=UPI00159522C4|nr:hypothetical protein [Lentibacillus sp. CBA3610]QKY69219.1 hypothetical protein Len3610_05980 [Lentibacillus sp. CBA3610]
MTIGTLLTIEKLNPETEKRKTYRSKIIEKNEHYLFLSLLIDNETNSYRLMKISSNLLYVTVSRNSWKPGKRNYHKVG